MIPAKIITHRFKRLPIAHSATHQFTLGQAVRLKGALWPSGNIFLITAKLPPSGDSPQYRIRNEAENFERMTTQVNLEPVSSWIGGESVDLAERSFGLDQGARS
jgi:hypothetical protein